MSGNVPGMGFVGTEASDPKVVRRWLQGFAQELPNRLLDGLIFRESACAAIGRQPFFKTRRQLDGVCHKEVSLILMARCHP